MFGTMRGEMSELVQLVRCEATWSTAITRGKTVVDEVSAVALTICHADAKPIAVLTRCVASPAVQVGEE